MCDRHGVNLLTNQAFFLMSISIILFIIGKLLVNGELDGLVAVYFVSSVIISLLTFTFISIFEYNVSLALL